VARLEGVVSGPLAGVRVLDLGWTWAGPFAGMILTDLGAEVIKVESGQRIDVLRWSGAFADGVRDHERSGYNNACNRGKQSVTIDLKHPDGRQLVLDLAGRCDVAIENFSPRVLPGLRLGWDDLSRANPRLVMLSLSAYGASGPEQDYIAYGDHLLYASGMTSVTGHPDDPPTPIGTFYGDPVAGIYGALAILAALAERDRTGAGQHLEYAQIEGLVSMMPGALIATSAGGDVVRSVDKSPDMAPHGFYRCAGDDAWVAIAVEDDDRWRALRELMRASGAAVPEWSTLAARKADETSVDQVIGAWVQPLSPWQVTTALQAAGVAAFPLMSAARLLWDHHLHQRDFFAWVEHPVTGPGPIPGVVFRVGADGARVRGAAPLLGQHNEQVFGGLLGLSEDRYRDLVASGAITAVPLPNARPRPTERPREDRGQPQRRAH
jgi:crotonobetainyl-CoA:carnitine CoA-transferase CaiB-like acyl-CoA transferase